MISFTRNNGATATIVFRHHGRRPKKAPTATSCYIYQGDTKDNRVLVADAMTRPCKDYPEIVLTNQELMRARAKYGRRIKREMKLPSGDLVLIIRGDNFSYEEGRKTSLTKALDLLHKSEREAAWDAYFSRNDIIELEDVVDPPYAEPFTEKDADDIIKLEA
jgi:hypothetical protein